MLLRLAFGMSKGEFPSRERDPLRWCLLGGSLCSPPCRLQALSSVGGRQLQPERRGQLPGSASARGTAAALMGLTLSPEPKDGFAFLAAVQALQHKYMFLELSKRTI